MTLLGTTQSVYQQRVDKLLNKHLQNTNDHAPKLKEAMAYALFNGGKRMRPFLVYATGEMLGAKLEALDSAAIAIECIHAYSLIHDDLPAMDDDDLRRGKPTCHIAFDEATAILAGDALQTMAFEAIANTGMSSSNPSNSLHLIKLLANASGYQGMCGGQAMDLAATNQQIAEHELRQLHQLKTGALLKAAVQMATVVAPNVSADSLEQLGVFSDALGLAFQVQDDILDVVGDSTTLGKPQGSDQAHNKSTYPSLMGLSGAKKYLAELHQQALHALDALPYNTEVLSAFNDFIVKRDH